MHAASWLDARWQVEMVDLERGVVTFAKFAEGAPPFPVQAPYRKKLLVFVSDTDDNDTDDNLAQIVSLGLLELGIQPMTDRQLIDNCICYPQG